MKIAMVASESNPLVKTGGLGDVVYSLSKELAIIGEEVAIVIPYYESIQRMELVNVKYLTSFYVHMSWRNQLAKVYQTYIDGISYYLIDCPNYFGRGHLYGDFDDGERFAFFTQAAQLLFPAVNFCPDIIHVHDWQPGMLACLIKESHDPFYQNTHFVFTIHNPAFQGLLPKFCLGDFYNLSDEYFDNGTLRFKEQFSTFKAGIVYSDKITTVSPTCRSELLTEFGGMGLNYVLELRRNDFCGFLNGIDTAEFNPQSDEYIAKTYDVTNVTKGKLANKKALLEKMHLDPLTDQPVFGMVSRFTWQKGMDLVFDAFEVLAEKGARIVLLGSGEYQYEQKAEALRAKYPQSVGIYIGYNNALAHEVYAGSDFFLMPSLFEPCGISQMIAQAYGSLPIVRRVGGLKDTILPYDGNNKNIADGYAFNNYDSGECTYTCITAYNNYFDKRLHHQLVKKRHECR